MSLVLVVSAFCLQAFASYRTDYGTYGANGTIPWESSIYVSRSSASISFFKVGSARYNSTKIRAVAEAYYIQSDGVIIVEGYDSHYTVGPIDRTFNPIVMECVEVVEVSARFYIQNDLVSRFFRIRP